MILVEAQGLGKTMLAKNIAHQAILAGHSALFTTAGFLAYAARAADLLFQLVSRRYEHRSLLITTNLPFKHWDTVFPNASCAVALIDRLTHHVEILVVEGRSRIGLPGAGLIFSSGNGRK